MITGRKPGDDRSDAELMALVANNDSEALGALYRRYGRMIYAILLRSLNITTDIVEDLCHDVFLKLRDKAPQYQEQGKLKGYLCLLATRQARDHRRKTVQRGKLLARFASPTMATAQNPTATSHALSETQIDISRALAVLPQTQREVFLLHTVEQLTGEDIAAVLDIGVNTVWTRLHRARKALRQALTRKETP